MPKYDDLNIIRRRVINNVTKTIRSFIKIEQEGYAYDDIGPYSEGISYWWYDISEASATDDHVTVNKNKVVPTQPTGNWKLVAVTYDGSIEMEMTMFVALAMIDLETKFDIEGVK